MADVENPTETILSKTVDTKITDDGTVITEETTVIEINGDHKPETKDEEVISGKVVNDDKKPSDENGEAVKDAAAEEKPVSDDTTPSAVVESEAANVVEEIEKKEQSPPKVILHQYPQSKSSPSISMFCLKLETFLRSHKIPYENQYGYKAGRKGKLPWIEYQGERKADSTFIIDFLNEKFELNIDNDLSDEQKALGRAVVAMIEDRLSFVMMYHRFIENYTEFKKTFPSGFGNSVALKMQQRKVRSYLDGHGMGRHSKEEIYHIAHEDVKAVSALLGNKDFILGEKPSTYDCSVFGFFSIVLWGGIDEPLSKYVNENASNIVAYCQRMKELYWTDWSDMILGDKPEPTLKKGFSFRRKKGPKVQKTKETDAENLDSAADTEEVQTKESKPSEETKEDSMKTVEEGESKTEVPVINSESKVDEQKPEEDKLEEVKKTENIDSQKAEEAITNEE